ncbi:MAG: cation:proton antiporter [Burkholderiales bacterium]|jgi:Kef-type K+ transport system membrane component KefB|nr:cation:proton antiporter [Burkholderiales bacterium]
MDTLTLLAVFSACYLVTWFLAKPVRKVGVSATIIELIVGFILGSWLISFEAAKAIGSISEIGALALFFLVGLHTNISEAKTFRRDIAAVVAIGAIVPIAIMLGIYGWLKLTPVEALFATATIMATGVGVIMRVLQEYRYGETKSGRFLLACSVIEDFPAILLLSFASSFAKHGAFNSQMLTGLLVTLGLGILCVLVAKTLIGKMHIPTIPLPLVLPAMIIAAYITNIFGFTSLLGAFLVGLLCKHSKQYDYEGYTKPVMDFFIPVFFIMVGMRIKLETIMQPESWLLAAILTAVAFASKLLCFVGIRKETKTLNIDPWIVAFGMLPRGLPGLVFATVALNSGFISDTLFAGLIIMVTATNTIGLTLLSYRLKSQLL